MTGQAPFIHYQPADGRCGDYIPFYWDGEFHLFYIFGALWRHVTTRDFVRFTEHGVALDGGGEKAQDANIFTGSLIEKDGVFYIFYTGHNPRSEEYGFDCQQVVMRATSQDLVNWKKDPGFLLPPDTSRYRPNAWRDPYLFWNAEAGEYWMIVTGATRTGFDKRWGCTALATSADLNTWTVKDPIYAPGLFDSHECPDIFEWDGRWYLVFSTYTRHWETRYRVADSPTGPWRAPKDDLFEGRAFYAAKTVSDGKHRYIVGWLSEKEGRKDDGVYLWGGSLLVHEVVPRADGSLGVRCPDTIRAAFPERLGLDPKPWTGSWETDGGLLSADATHTRATMALAPTPSRGLFRTTITCTPGTHSAGVLLRAGGGNLSNWYELRIEPTAGRIVFDRSANWFKDHSFVEERPVELPPDVPIDVTIVMNDSIVTAYVNDVALSARIHDIQEGDLGLFAAEGAASFSDTELRTV